MKTFAWVLILVGICSAVTLGRAQSFSDQLSPAQQAAFGLDKLTAEERAALFESIELYKKTGAAEAAQAAAKEAVAEYKKKEEPSIVARAVELFKSTESERQQERFTGVLRGKFRGWEGRTDFYLENGQVWRQTSNDTYYPKAREGVEVVIYKSKSGYFRLQILDDEGAWVTVKRVR